MKNHYVSANYAAYTTRFLGVNHKLLAVREDKWAHPSMTIL